MPSVRHLSRVVLGLIWLTGLACGHAAASSPNPDIDPGSALDAPAPGFELRDENGRRRSLAELRGKVVLLAFVDPHCESVCPLTTESMVQALRMLGPAALRVQLLGVNANPLATSVHDVAAYTREHHMQGRWWFLTGPEPVLAPVWRDYGVYIASEQGDIDHQPLMVLIDARGHARKVYYTQMSYGGLEQQAVVLAQGIAPLLPGHVVVRPPVSLEYVPPLPPDATARLPTLRRTGGPIVLAATQPHLVLFFASWLSGASLPARLAVLDGYRALARRHGWPQPVAIDELPTERQSDAWRLQMKRLASGMQTPLAVDSRGRVADGYGVHDLPWFALVSSGSILWRHDGWLSLQSLAGQVRVAWHDRAAGPSKSKMAGETSRQPTANVRSR